MMSMGIMSIGVFMMPMRVMSIGVFVMYMGIFISMDIVVRAFRYTYLYDRLDIIVIDNIITIGRIKSKSTGRHESL